MKSSDMWARIEAAKQAIKNELVSLSQDIGPEFGIDVEIEWRTSGSSQNGVSSRAPRVEVAVTMKTMTGGAFWLDSGSRDYEIGTQVGAYIDPEVAKAS